MQLNLATLEAMLYCPYKSWRLAAASISNQAATTLPVSVNNKIVHTAWEIKHALNAKVVIKE